LKRIKPTSDEIQSEIAKLTASVRENIICPSNFKQVAAPTDDGKHPEHYECSMM